MILPAIVALGSRVSRAYSYEPSCAAIAAAVVKKFAFEAFPQWASTNHVDLCPASLADLTELAGRKDTIDPWGRPYEMRCGPGYPGLYVRSAGEDGRFETTDDISSND